MNYFPEWTPETSAHATAQNVPLENREENNGWTASIVSTITTSMSAVYNFMSYGEDDHPLIRKAIQLVPYATPLIRENRDMILAGDPAYVEQIARAISTLTDEGIFTQENRDAVMVEGGAFANFITHALLKLHRAHLLQENRDRVVAIMRQDRAHAYATSELIGNMLFDGSRTERGSLTQCNLDVVLARGGTRVITILERLEENSPFSQSGIRAYLHELPPRRPFQEKLNDILRKIEEEEQEASLETRNDLNPFFLEYRHNEPS